MTNRFFYDSPARFALFSFTLLIFIGTFFLWLPIARLTHISLLDLLLTATSATCVTGLLPVSLHEFTYFGKVIIMILMQLGALGLSTIGLSIIYFLKNPTLSTQAFAAHVLELDEISSVKNLLVFIIKTTFLIESIALFLLFPIFYQKYSFGLSIFLSLFHVISSFCNAGISYEYVAEEQHLTEFSTNIFFLIITMGLMFLGGIGFITLQELFSKIKSKIATGKSEILLLHSKIVLSGSCIFLFIFAAFFFFIEQYGAFSLFSFPMKIVQSLFHAISFKSCGFSTVTLSHFHPATLFLAMLSGFIGSAPGSTGSGVKIVSFVLYIALIKSIILGKNQVEIGHRSISTTQVLKSVAIVSLSAFLICCMFFVLLFSDNHQNFFNLLFLITNAMTNLGLAVNDIRYISVVGKTILILAMIMGRIGVLSAITSMRLKYGKSVKQEFSYPEERVMLG